MQHLTDFSYNINDLFKFEINHLKGVIVVIIESDFLKPFGGLIVAWMTDLYRAFEPHGENPHREDVLDDEGGQVE